MSDLDRLLERDLSRVAALGDGSPPPDVPAIRRRGVQRRRRQTVVAVAAAVTLVLLVGGLVTRPGSGRERAVVPVEDVRNGELVVQTDSSLLTAVAPDGSSSSTLMTLDEPGDQFWNLRFSPDGTRLAFLFGSPDRSSPGAVAIYVADADGTHVRRLARCPGHGDCSVFDTAGLAWAPDGSALAVTAEGALYVVDATAGGLRQLPVGAGGATAPAWSPDGVRIAFGQGTRLRTIEPDGSALTTLAAGLPGVSDVDWSPDGTRLVVSGSPSGVYVVRSRGGAPDLIVAQKGYEGPAAASWSPDGRHIAYFTTPGRPGRFHAELRVADPVAGTDRLLQQSDCCISDWAPPVWSPDGTRIALYVEIDGHPSQSGLFLVPAEGSGVPTRVDLPAYQFRLAWQPLP